MADIRVGIDSSGARSGGADVRNELNRIGDSAEKNIGAFDNQVNKVGASLVKLAAGSVSFLAIKRGLTEALGSSIQFNREMANVNALLGGNTQRLNELAQGVRQVSIDMGNMTGDLTAGLYQTISAFGDASSSIGRLSIAAKVGQAGVSSTADALNYLSAVTKAYNDTSETAIKRAGDLGLATVRLGQTTFPQLAASIGQVAPIAAGLHVSFEELMALYSTLTGVTGSTSEVTTQLVAAMSALTKPTSELQKVLDELNISSIEVAISQQGFVKVLGDIIAKTDGSAAAINKMLPRVTSLPALLALNSSQAETFAIKLADITSAAGETDKAFVAQASGLAALGKELDRSKSGMSIFLQLVGEQLTPSLLSLIQDTNASALNLKKLEAAAIEATTAIKTLASVLAVGGSLAVGIQVLNKGIPLLYAAIGSLNPVTAAIGAVSLLAGAFTYMSERQEQAKDRFEKYLETAGKIQPYGDRTVTTLDDVNKKLEEQAANAKRAGVSLEEYLKATAGGGDVNLGAEIRSKAQGGDPEAVRLLQTLKKSGEEAQKAAAKAIEEVDKFIAAEGRKVEIIGKEGLELKLLEGQHELLSRGVAKNSAEWENYWKLLEPILRKQYELEKATEEAKKGKETGKQVEQTVEQYRQQSELVGLTGVALDEVVARHALINAGLKVGAEGYEAQYQTLLKIVTAAREGEESTSRKKTLEEVQKYIKLGKQEIAIDKAKGKEKAHLKAAMLLEQKGIKTTSDGYEKLLQETEDYLEARDKLEKDAKKKSAAEDVKSYLMSEEEALLDSYNKRRQAIIDYYSDASGITAEGLALLAKLNVDYHKKVEGIEGERVSKNKRASKAQEDQIYAVASSYSNVFSALSSMFSENSAAHKIFAATAIITDTAIAVMKSFSLYGPTPLGYASAAAMIALGGIQLAKIGGGGGGGGGVGSGGGTQSQPSANLYQGVKVEDYEMSNFSENSTLIRELRALTAALHGLTGALTGEPASPYGFNFDIPKRDYNFPRYNLEPREYHRAVGDFSTGQGYSGYWFTGGMSGNSGVGPAITGELDKYLDKTFASLETTLGSASSLLNLGGLGDKSYHTDIYLKDMNSQQRAEAIAAGVSAVADQMALDLLPELVSFKEENESAFETLVRLSNEMSAFSGTFERIGYEITDLFGDISGVELIGAVQGIAALSGGMDEFLDLFEDFRTGLYNEIDIARQNLDYSREDLVTGINLIGEETGLAVNQIVRSLSRNEISTAQSELRSLFETLKNGGKFAQDPALLDLFVNIGAGLNTLAEDYTTWSEAISKYQEKASLGQGVSQIELDLRDLADEYNNLLDSMEKGSKDYATILAARAQEIKEFFDGIRENIGIANMKSLIAKAQLGDERFEIRKLSVEYYEAMQLVSQALTASLREGGSTEVNQLLQDYNTVMTAFLQERNDLIEKYQDAYQRQLDEALRRQYESQVSLVEKAGDLWESLQEASRTIYGLSGRNPAEAILTSAYQKLQEGQGSNLQDIFGTWLDAYQDLLGEEVSALQELSESMADLATSLDDSINALLFNQELSPAASLEQYSARYSKLQEEALTGNDVTAIERFTSFATEEYLPFLRSVLGDQTGAYQDNWDQVVESLQAMKVYASNESFQSQQLLEVRQQEARVEILKTLELLASHDEATAEHLQDLSRGLLTISVDNPFERMRDALETQLEALNKTAEDTVDYLALIAELQRLAIPTQGYATGLWNVEHNEEPALLHAGEMVVRASDAPYVRRFLQDSGRATGYGVPSSRNEVWDGESTSGAGTTITIDTDAIGRAITNALTPLVAQGGDNEIHVHVHLGEREILDTVAEGYKYHTDLIQSTRRAVGG